MFQRIGARIRTRWYRIQVGWKKSMEGRAAIYLKDGWHDYWQTLREVSEEKTLAQLLAALTAAGAIFLLHLILWAALSALLGYLISVAWNHSAIQLLPNDSPYMFLPYKLTFIQGWASSFLGILLFFRNIRIEVNVQNSRKPRRPE